MGIGAAPSAYTRLSWLMGSVSVVLMGCFQSTIHRLVRVAAMVDDDTYSDFLEQRSVHVVPHRLQLQRLTRLLPMPSPHQPHLHHKLRQLLLLPLHARHNPKPQRPLRLLGSIRHVHCLLQLHHTHTYMLDGACRVPFRGQAPNLFYFDTFMGICFKCPVGCLCNESGCYSCDSDTLRFNLCKWFVFALSVCAECVFD
jgi:hypothetical protein